MQRNSKRENREAPQSPAQVITGGPLREGQGRTPEMHERGESYGPVVPAKQPNNAARAGAGVVEERGPAKENAASKTPPGHRAGTGVSSALGRVRQVARGEGSDRRSRTRLAEAPQRGGFAARLQGLT